MNLIPRVVIANNFKMATAKLKYVPLENQGLQPLIVQFTNGCLTADRKGKKKDGLKFSYYRWADGSDNRKKQRRTLVAETERMEYNGQNFGQFARTNSLCKYLVGMLDKTSGEMKIYDAQMFTMQPKVLEKAAATSYDDTEDSKKDLSFTEKTDRLTEAFGSTKKKRAMVSRQKNVIDKEDLDSTVVSAVSGAALESALDEQEKSVAQSSTIPPFNKDAKSPEKIPRKSNHTSSKMKTQCPSEYEAIKRPAIELTRATRDLLDQWRHQNRFPEYILQHVAVMPLNPLQRAHKSCLLMYLSYMIRMYQLNYTNMTRKDPFPDYPDAVKHRLLSTFTLENPVNTGLRCRLFPKRLKDRLLSYILVLALIIDEFVMDCNVIAKDLKIDLKRLSNHLRILGCVVESTGAGRKRKADGSAPITETRIATLKVPLPSNFPNVGFRK